MVKQQQIIWIVIISILIVSLIPKNNNMDFDEAGLIDTVVMNDIDGNWDISNEVMVAGLGQYLIEESDFDYSDPDVMALATEIKKNTFSAEEAIKQTAKIVAQNTEYSAKVSISACYDEKASTVINDGIGDCVSMSRLVTALLRAQGVPARTVGGCLSSFNRCEILFSTIPFLEPQVTPLVEGDFKKRGFLHEWVEAWEPSRGWVTIEATAGRIYSQDCGQYLFYSYDSNNVNRCTINDRSFWNECRTF